MTSTVEPLPSIASARPRATLRDYVAIARPDHWSKHVFIVPGIVLAWLLHPVAPAGLIAPMLAGLAAACAAASANYVINEWLDAATDRFHPKKKSRPAVHKQLVPGIVLAEYFGLAVLGVTLGTWVSPLFVLTLCVFLLSGVVYNVPPIRTKNRPYLDVTSEALNNPIRLTLGWAMVSPDTLPPSSLLLAYWMGGAFLMAIKRFAEYRTVAADGALEDLKLYRRSFQWYTEERLLVSAFLYAQLAAFFLAIFLIKYRVEYLLSLPLFAALFASYLRIGLKHESTAQAPEKLFRETALMVLLGLLVLVLGLLTWIDLPGLEHLADPHYLPFPSSP